jgi:hypothetical protein
MGTERARRCYLHAMQPHSRACSCCFGRWGHRVLEMGVGGVATRGDLTPWEPGEEKREVGATCGAVADVKDDTKVHPAARVNERGRG